MKKALLTISSLLIVSCSPITGIFKAQEDLSFKGIKYVTGWGSEVPVAQGEYKSSITMENKKTLLLKITKEGQSNPVEVRFKIPKDTSLPEYNGELELTAKDAKQNYDLFAQVETEFHSSSRMHGTESCTWESYRRVCREICRLENGRRICRDECFNETVTHYGSQDVEYHYDYTDRDFNINILKPGTEEVVGNFTGEDHDSDKVYDYHGRCY